MCNEDRVREIKRGMFAKDGYEHKYLTGEGFREHGPAPEREDHSPPLYLMLTSQRPDHVDAFPLACPNCGSTGIELPDHAGLQDFSDNGMIIYACPDCRVQHVNGYYGEDYGRAGEFTVTAQIAAAEHKSQRLDGVELDPDSRVPLSFIWRRRRVEVARCTHLVTSMPKGDSAGDERASCTRLYRVETQSGYCWLRATQSADASGRFPGDWHIAGDDLGDDLDKIVAAVDPCPLDDNLVIDLFGREVTPELDSADLRKYKQKCDQTSRMRVLNTRAYELVCNLESRLRSLVVDVLRKKHDGQAGMAWWTQEAPSDILDEVKKRFERAKREAEPWGYHLKVDPIAYTTLAELGVLMRKKTQLFKHVFPKPEILLGKLEEIGFIRNHIAHSRAITETMLVNLETYARQVGGILSKHGY